MKKNKKLAITLLAALLCAATAAAADPAAAVVFLSTGTVGQPVTAPDTATINMPPIQIVGVGTTSITYGKAPSGGVAAYFSGQAPPLTWTPNEGFGFGATFSMAGTFQFDPSSADSFILGSDAKTAGIGQPAYMRFDQDGTYLSVCSERDPATGKPVYILATLPTITGGQMHTFTATLANGKLTLTIDDKTATTQGPAGFVPAAPAKVYLGGRPTAWFTGWFGDFKLAIGATALPPPKITSVVNAASYAAADGVSPGTIATIVGAALVTARNWSNAFAADGSYPTSLGGSAVEMLGADNKWTGLAVTYFGPTQANFVFPYSVIGSTAKLRMVTPLGTSDPFQVNVTPVSPGLFVSYVDAKGAEYPAAVGVTPSGAWYYLGPAAAGAAYRLAAPGDVILLYGTGFGPTTPALAGTKSVVGAAALNSPVKIYIGGNETPLAWAGVVEVDGFAQLNVAIPNLPAGTYPLQAEVGGVKTPTVLLAVGAGQ